MIHLDASFLIRALVAGSPQDGRARAWLERGERFGTSVIAWTEFLCGPLSAEHKQLAARLVSVRLPFGEKDAGFAAHLYNETGRRRGSLADCMIASIAVGNEAALATENVADFRRFVPFGLKLAG